MKDRKNRRSIKEGALLQYKAFRGSVHGRKEQKKPQPAAAFRQVRRAKTSALCFAAACGLLHIGKPFQKSVFLLAVYAKLVIQPVLLPIGKAEFLLRFK